MKVKYMWKKRIALAFCLLTPCLSAPTSSSSYLSYDQAEGFNDIQQISLDPLRFIALSPNEKFPKLIEINEPRTNIQILKQNALSSSDTTKNLKEKVSKVHSFRNGDYVIALSESINSNTNIMLFKRYQDGYKLETKELLTQLAEYRGNEKIKVLTYPLKNTNYERVFIYFEESVSILGMSLDTSQNRFVEESFGISNLPANYEGFIQVLNLQNLKINPFYCINEGSSGQRYTTGYFEDLNFNFPLKESKFLVRPVTSHSEPNKKIFINHPIHFNSAILLAYRNLVGVSYQTSRNSVEKWYGFSNLNILTPSYKQLETMKGIPKTEYIFALLNSDSSSLDLKPLLRLIHAPYEEFKILSIENYFKAKFGTKILLFSEGSKGSILTISKHGGQVVFYMEYGVNQLCIDPDRRRLGDTLTEAQLDFYLGSDGECKKASELDTGECKTVNPLSEICASCKILYMSGTKCENSCINDSTYFDGTSCKPCHEKNEGCEKFSKDTNLDFKKCSQCNEAQAQYILSTKTSQTKCVLISDYCPSNEFYDKNLKSCISCQKLFNGCLECKNSPLICTKCQQKFIEIPQEKKCYPCIQNCLECLDQKSCKKCEKNFEYFEKFQKCLIPCKNSQFMDNSGTCINCLEFCDVCESKTTCKKCQGNKFFLEGLKKCKEPCKNNEFRNLSGSCQSCGKGCKLCEDETGTCSECKEKADELSEDKKFCQKKIEKIKRQELKLNQKYFELKTTTIHLKFQKKLETEKIDLSKKLKIKINNSADQKEIELAIEKFQFIEGNYTLLITLKLEEEIKDGIIEISNTNIIESCIEEYGELTNHIFLEEKIILENINFFTTKLAEIFRSSKKTVASTLKSTTGASMIISQNSGSTQLKLFQHFVLLRFINIPLPLNYLNFLDFFSENILDVFPNFFESEENHKSRFEVKDTDERSEDVCVEFHRKLSENGYNCYLINNVGNIFLQAAFLGLFTLVIFSIKNKDNEQKLKKGKFWIFLNFLRNNFGWKFLFGFVAAVEIDLFVSVFINLRNFFVNPFWTFLNSFLSVMILIGFLWFILKNFKLVSKSKKLKEKLAKEDPENKNYGEFGFLVEEIDQKSLGKISLYFEQIILLRDFLIILFSIFFLDSPLIQILASLILTVGTLAVILRSPPYTKKLQNITIILNEFFYALLLVCFLILWVAGNFIGEKKKFVYFGNFMIFLSSVSIILNLAFSVYEGIVQISKYLKEKKLNKKEIPQNNDSSQINLGFEFEEKQNIDGNGENDSSNIRQQENDMRKKRRRENRKRRKDQILKNRRRRQERNKNDNSRSKSKI